MKDLLSEMLRAYDASADVDDISGRDSSQLVEITLYYTYLQDEVNNTKLCPIQAGEIQKLSQLQGRYLTLYCGLSCGVTEKYSPAWPTAFLDNRS